LQAAQNDEEKNVISRSLQLSKYSISMPAANMFIGNAADAAYATATAC